MMSYKEVLRICKGLNLNPEIVGDNVFADSKPLLYKPFNLVKIKNFPKKQLEQIFPLGQVVYNLNSQTLFFPRYDLTSKEGKMKMENDLKIKKVISAIVATMEFLLFFGLYKSKSEKILIIHNGQIFEPDEEEQKKVQKINTSMAEVHLDFKRKEIDSEQSSKNVILNS